MSRLGKQYTVTDGVLVWSHRERPERKGQPFSRAVLESGTAIKTVYLSKAQEKTTEKEAERILQFHERDMRKEMQKDGRLILRLTRIMSGQRGDVRLLADWVILGVKKTKHHRRAMLRSDASHVRIVEGSSAVP